MKLNISFEDIDNYVEILEEHQSTVKDAVAKIKVFSNKINSYLEKEMYPMVRLEIESIEKQLTLLINSIKFTNEKQQHLFNYIKGRIKKPIGRLQQDIKPYLLLSPDEIERLRWQSNALHIGQSLIIGKDTLNAELIKQLKKIAALDCLKTKLYKKCFFSFSIGKIYPPN